MNILSFSEKKRLGEKVTMMTCYDYPSARIIANSDIDCVLVGDSVAMAVHGHPNTVTATMDMMTLHTEAVARGLSTQFLIADLPFLSYHGGFDLTLQHVKQLLQVGAHAIKLEGGHASICQTIQQLVTAGVPVMGHIGLTPQSVHQLGGFRVQGKTEAHATRLLQEAQALQDAGCFAIVLECVPAPVAAEITQTLEIATIGIGAGAQTDGQVLVWHDALGMQPNTPFRFVKQFMTGYNTLLTALNTYAAEVKTGLFPTKAHQYDKPSTTSVPPHVHHS